MVKTAHSDMKVSLFNSNRSDLEPLTPPLETGLQLRRSESRAKKPMTPLVASESMVQDPGSASRTRAAASSLGTLP